MKLYHVTTEKDLDDTLANGVPGGNRWIADESVARRQAERVAESGENPAIVGIEFNEFQADGLKPDMQGILDPVDKPKADVEAEWADAKYGGRWEDTLDIVGSVQYDDLVPAEALVAVENLEPATPKG